MRSIRQQISAGIPRSFGYTGVEIGDWPLSQLGGTAASKAQGRRKRSSEVTKAQAREWSTWFSTTEAMRRFTSSSASFIIENFRNLFRRDASTRKLYGLETLWLKRRRGGRERLHHPLQQTLLLRGGEFLQFVPQGFSRLAHGMEDKFIPRFGKLLFPAIILMLTLLLTGCASVSTPQISLTGDILVDGPRMIAEGPARDQVLWQYRTAVAALRRGQFEAAKPLLDAALARLQGVYGPDSEARKSRGVFQRESRKTFIGEPYERSMAYLYRGMIYWRDGELDNARACFRSAEFEDSDAENQEYQGDWVLPDYLDGLATVKLGGDGRDALQRARANARNITLPDYQPQANVLCFVEYGPGPEKYRAGSYGEELRFRARRSEIFSATIKTGAIVQPVAPCDDLNFQATTRGGRLMDHVLANKAVFKGATDSAGDMALFGGLATATVSRDRTVQSVGLGVALAGLIAKGISSAATPEADIRQWDNLPQFISFASLKLTPGNHVLTVEFNNAGRASLSSLTKTINVNVRADRDTVVYVSDSSTTPENQ